MRRRRCLISDGLHKTLRSCTRTIWDDLLPNPLRRMGKLAYQSLYRLRSSCFLEVQEMRGHVFLHDVLPYGSRGRKAFNRSYIDPSLHSYEYRRKEQKYYFFPFGRADNSAVPIGSSQRTFDKRLLATTNLHRLMSGANSFSGRDRYKLYQTLEYLLGQELLSSRAFAAYVYLLRKSVRFKTSTSWSEAMNSCHLVD
jgi:hypothetical protein